MACTGLGNHWQDENSERIYDDHKGTRKEYVQARATGGYSHLAPPVVVGGNVAVAKREAVHNTTESEKKPNASGDISQHALKLTSPPAKLAWPMRLLGHYQNVATTAPQNRRRRTTFDVPFGLDDAQTRVVRLSPKHSLPDSEKRGPTVHHKNTIEAIHDPLRI